ncbi:MAG: hypothetical protein A3D92_02240 [Bacteroidetes bacterium RIFCSPHIGHO2_02_FULL_44_7]|nr:MAG: hypothetical protein A3D92_02240 [Bacteroidetes bacterium RIFCSPHIGHO2_02_FULL_44_7]
MKAIAHFTQSQLEGLLAGALESLTQYLQLIFKCAVQSQGLMRITLEREVKPLTKALGKEFNGLSDSQREELRHFAREKGFDPDIAMAFIDEVFRSVTKSEKTE